MSHKSLKEKAFERIRADIVANVLKPGQPLNERELSEQLKISKTPIREAIQMLYKEGFVQVINQKGCFVSPVTLSDINEIMQIREGLEPIAAGDAAMKRDPEMIRAFEEKFESIAQDPDRKISVMSDAGMRLHGFLIESTRNQRLINLLSNLNIHMQRIRNIYCLQTPYAIYDKTLAEHQSILKAVKEQNPREAEKLMRRHIAAYWEFLKKFA